MNAMFTCIATDKSEMNTDWIPIIASVITSNLIWKRIFTSYATIDSLICFTEQEQGMLARTIVECLFATNGMYQI